MMDGITKPTHAYVGRCERCNGVVASVADLRDRAYRKGTASSVAQWIRDGYIVERVAFGTEGVMVDGCACNRQPAEQPLPLFEQSTT